MFVDPDSPAGKEYAVPLDQARRDAAGRAPGGPAGEAAGASAKGEPLFGVGIEPQRGSDAGGGSGKSGNAEGGTGAGGGSGGDGAGGADEARSTAAVTAASEEGSGLPLTIGIAGAVLAGGVAAGLGLRRLLGD